MKVISPFELYNCDYSLSDINALKQYWTSKNLFSCIGRPKSCNMLLFLDGFSAEYTLRNGKKLYANNNSIVYTPTNSEYSVRFFNLNSENSNTIGINFSLYDSQNNPFVLNDQVTVYEADNVNYKSIFNKIDTYSEANIICIGKVKSVMYDLLFKLSEYYRTDYCGKYRIISNGITYLEHDEEQALKIADIAALCNVSEVYFRKLFREYSGMTPTEYRTASKLSRAKIYLRQNQLSVTEISDRLGFGDVAYFIKLFREANGITPKIYRRQFEKKSFKA